ncbi:MAG: DUF2520 domain-containing protein [Limnochordales bacterium]|nr:DUF2520 domain-containing protein [Limnochordales bacterium]
MGEMRRRFAIVGPGRVGRALGLALAARGMVPVGVWGRAEHQTEGRATAKAHATGGALAAAGDRLARLAAELCAPARTLPSPELAEADWLFLTVPDRELAVVADRFDRSGFVRSDTVWIHTAGAYGVEVLPAGRPRLALHPPASISGDPAELEELTWAVEADGAQATEAVAQIIGLLHGRMVSVPGERRAFYHAATAVAANLSAAVWLLAEEMLTAIGFDQAAAHQAVVRLAQSSLTNLERAGAAGVTGPVRRGDVETVERHLQALKSFGTPYQTETYRRLSLLLACELAKEGILIPADVLEWKRLLSTEGPD